MQNILQSLHLLHIYRRPSIQNNPKRYVAAIRSKKKSSRGRRQEKCEKAKRAGSGTALAPQMRWILMEPREGSAARIDNLSALAAAVSCGHSPHPFHPVIL